VVKNGNRADPREQQHELAQGKGVTGQYGRCSELSGVGMHRKVVNPGTPMCPLHRIVGFGMPG